MKLGYSMLLGEYIEAKVVEYGDCTQFQIVCPYCKEPVFKVIRDASQELHYLAHYNKSKAYIAECDLRLSGITNEHIRQADWFSRDQRIKFFLGALRSMFEEAQISSEDLRKNLSACKVSQKSKILKFMRELSHRHAKDIFKQNIDLAKESIDCWIEEYNEFAEVPLKTGFSIGVQKRIAMDFWEHILSANARDSFDYLYNHAYHNAINRISASQKARELKRWEYDLANYMIKLRQASLNQGYSMMDEMKEYPVVRDNGRKSLLHIMNAEITHEMIGLLTTLPYLEWLKKGSTDKKMEAANRL